MPRGVLRLYRSYSFIDDKDPGIDKLRTIVQDSGLSEEQLHILSGVSVTTFAGWFRGDVRRPQHATMAATAAALGYEWELRKTKVIDYQAELPKARKWLDARDSQRKRGPNVNAQRAPRPARTRAA